MNPAKFVFFLLLAPMVIYGFFPVIKQTGFFQSDFLPAAAVAPSQQPSSEMHLAASDSQDIVEEVSGSMSAVRNQNQIQLSATIFDADKVEFYAKNRSLSVPLYLGRAVYDGDGNWSYGFDLSFRPLPEGEYRIYAEVTAANKVFRTGETGLAVSNPSGGQNPAAASIIKTVNDNLAAVRQNEEAIDAAVREAAVSMILLAGDNEKIRPDLLLFSTVIREIENENRALTKNILARQDTNEIVRRLETEISGLPENTIAAIRSEKISQHGMARETSRKIDEEIAAIQSRLEEKKQARQPLFDGLSGLAPQKKSEAEKIISDLERTVSGIEFDTIAKKAALDKDTDGDSMSDENEIAAKTDPADPDTDGDGALDGDENANGHDPLIPADFDAGIGNDPRQSNPLLADIYKVGQIESAKASAGGFGFRLQGNALPNAYAQVFIYSVPLTVIVKADDQGFWEYNLDAEFPDGLHSACVVQIDSRGQTQGRSELAWFQKEGDSVYRVFTEQKSVLPASVEGLRNNFGIYAGFITLLALAISLLAIGFITTERKLKNPETKNDRT